MSGLTALFLLSAAAASAPDSDMFAYHVAAHESLFTIAQRGLTTTGAYREVQNLNHVLDPLHLPVGKTLKIPRRLLRSTPISVTVEGYRGAVSVEAAGERAPAAVGRTFSEGAVVETGENAFARLALPDGSHLALPSNSRVRFDRLRMVILTGAIDRAMTLERGRTESEVTPMKDPGSRYVISTPVAMTSVRGTLFRATYDPKLNVGSAGVTRGVVAVSKGSALSVINAGQGLVATASGLSKPEALLPAPTFLHANVPQTEDGLQFDLTPIPGAKLYRVRLANDEAMTIPVREETFTTPTAESAGLPDGIYYAELTAIAADGLEGKSAVYNFVRLRSSLTIGDVAQVSDKQGRRAVFHWESAGAVAPVFHFELRRDADQGPPLVDKVDLTESQYSVADLPAGVYKWRVTATRALAGRRVQVWSDPQTLKIEK
jgi:hypothetical protein